MFFLIGLFIGMFAGAVSVVAWGLVALLLRRPGLIPTTAAAAWGVAVLPALCTAAWWLYWWHDHEIPSDPLARGFFNFCGTGVLIGVALAARSGAKRLRRRAQTTHSTPPTGSVRE